MFKKLSKRELYILIISAIIIVCLLLFYYVFFSLRDKYNVLQSAVVARQRKIALLNKVIRQRDAIEQAFEYIEKKNFLDKEVPQPLLLKRIQEAADKSNVTVTSIKPIPAISDGGTNSFRIEAEADLLSVIKYLNNLQSINMSLKLKYMQIDAARSENLKIQLVLNTISSYDDTRHPVKKSN
ncbi:MAG: hypothetical protein ABH952_02265 [Candidatus Omnitrophota bacterium]